MVSKKVSKLVPTLESIPDADVRTPDRSSYAVVEEAFNRSTKIRAGALGDNLAKLRLPADIPEQLQLAATALGELNAVWLSHRRNASPDEAKAFELEAEAAYQRLKNTLLFATEGERAVRRTLADAADATTNRSAGFFQLAAEFERHRGRFLPSDDLDPAALADEARTWAARTTGAEAVPAGADALRAKNLRDRAFTHLDRLLDRVDASATYFYGTDRAGMRAFTA